jgi:hypothetical protein
MNVSITLKREPTVVLSLELTLQEGRDFSDFLEKGPSWLEARGGGIAEMIYDALDEAGYDA